MNNIKAGKLKNKRNKMNLPKELLFFFFQILFLETVFRLYFTSLRIEGVFFTVAFSLPIALFFYFLTNLFKGKLLKVTFYFSVFLLCLVAAAQVFYTTIFGTMLSISSLTLSGITQGAGFMDNALAGLTQCWWIILICTLPLFISIILKKYFFNDNFKFTALFKQALLIVFTHAICLLLLSVTAGDANSAHDVYHKNFAINISAENVGLYTTTRLDLKYTIFGKPEVLIDETEGNGNDNIDYTDNTLFNVMNLNIDSLLDQSDDDVLESLHSYVLQKAPTNKNDYTGMFKDYNLIFVIAEGFSEYVIDENLTPTLYKMKHEGFVFNNYYNPIWDVSTSDGEYSILSGLLPNSGMWTFSETGIRENNMYFTLGKQFERLNYDTYAYHNYNYQYYDRHLSHPNMGYDYQGVGNGVNVSNVWPTSDYEMMLDTIPDFINSEKFHTYFLTMSGHLNYTFTGNTQAYRNRDVVDNLPYSDICKGYLACNYEVEKAMTYLVSELEAAKKLDNTLIVLTGDHYPYGLIQNGDDYSYFSEFLGHEADTEFEIFRNEALIWSPSMDSPITVDKYCSAIDLLPTVSNLLGLEYDSRLLVGTDVFSDNEPFIVFNNRNWISQDYKYIRETGELIPHSSSDTPDNSSTNGELSEATTASYINIMNAKANQMFVISRAIFKYDYYDMVIPKEQ